MDSDITVNHSVYKNAGKLLLASSFFSSSSSNFLPEYSSKYFSLDLGNLQILVCVTTKLTDDRLLK